MRKSESWRCPRGKRALRVKRRRKGVKVSAGSSLFFSGSVSLLRLVLGLLSLSDGSLFSQSFSQQWVVFDCRKYAYAAAEMYGTKLRDRIDLGPRFSFFFFAVWRSLTIRLSSGHFTFCTSSRVVLLSLMLSLL